MRAASTPSERSSKWKAASFNQRCAHASTVKRSRVLRSKVPERDGASSSSKLRFFTARNSLGECSLRLTGENAVVSPCERSSERASEHGKWRTRILQRILSFSKERRYAQGEEILRRASEREGGRAR